MVIFFFVFFLLPGFFCSSLNFQYRSVNNIVTKEPNIPVNFVPFLNDVSFLFCRFLKSGVTNMLKSLSV